MATSEVYRKKLKNALSKKAVALAVVSSLCLEMIEEMARGELAESLGDSPSRPKKARAQRGAKKKRGAKKARGKKVGAKAKARARKSKPKQKATQATQQ